MSGDAHIQGNLSSADLPSSKRRNATAAFAAECGLGGPLRFIVENTETEQSQTFDVFEPFVLIGRAPGCHLQLLHPDVCFRHAYCQVIQGRLYVFDLDSRHGIAWGSGLQHEGLLTPDSRLQIGPFVIRLSRAPAFTRSLVATAVDWRLENEPLENVRLWFENAAGRGSQSAMRPLRRQITVLGRSNRCHLKLSDGSVSKAHCAVVRTGVGYWVVDLLGKSGTTLNGQSVRFAPVGSEDRIGAGRFRVRIRELLAGQMDEPAAAVSTQSEHSDSSEMLPAVTLDGIARVTPPVDDASVRQHLALARDRLMLSAGQLPVPASDAAPGASDALILAMMEQFSHLQQQLLTHTQQQMTMLTEMFATLHKAQNDAVMGQLNRIQEISAELNALRAERGATSAAAGSESGAPSKAPETPMLDAPPTPTSVVAPAPVGTAEVITSPDRDAVTPAEEVVDVATSEAPTEKATRDDSDVVPVAAVDPSGETDVIDSEESIGATEGPETDESDETLTPSARASVPRFDAMAHARLTMRISQLERERNNRWKRLMQLVSGGPSSE